MLLGAARQRVQFGGMGSRPIVAHLIVGRRSEPYLPAVLESIGDVCSLAVINDNSGLIPGPNDDFLQASRLSAQGRTLVVRTAFDGFGAARNACIDATPHALRDGWVLFVDADEVHGDELAVMARALPSIASDVDAVDGYSRHFVGSFGWWRSLERRMCFFRDRADRRWSGVVHERLAPMGKRVVFPFVWAHYGHVVTPRMEWEKSRLYSSLGQPGFAPTDEQLSRVTAAEAWEDLRADAMRYHGGHPPAAAGVIAALSRDWAATFKEVDALFARCTPLGRVRREVRRANYARVLAMRRIAGLLGYSA